MRVEILRQAARTSTPWRNGGGVTFDIARHPPEAGLEDFAWRVSMALVERAGPFSIFPGIDRILTVLRGTLDLRFADGTAARLDAQSAPFAFAGDAACHGSCGAGSSGEGSSGEGSYGAGGEAAVLDLNVMTRRGEWRAAVLRIAGDCMLRGPHSLFLATAPARLRVAGQDMALGTHDALRLDGGPAALGLDGAGLLITLDRA